MLFNSFAFVVYFLPIVLVVFYALARWRKLKLAIAFLLVSSLFFYGYWNPTYLPLLIGSIALNHILGQRIQRATPYSPLARRLMQVGIAVNLGLLGYYKYAGFFVANLNSLIGTHLPSPTIVLPLAISFYSFTQIAYLIDAYRGEAHDYDPIVYGLFITFFPQLIAGPILRHDQLIPELEQRRIFVFSQRNVAIGLTIFILGLAKKVLIADTLSPWVAATFDQSATVSFYQAWFGALAYTLQLYFDFSGYSDMAVGIGRLFNVKIPINFNSPYQARSIADFWRRWHITLSDFLRDYLYIPLGGNRKGERRRYTNLVVTMLLGGLWHGAGWTFVAWGGLHGVYLVVHQLWARGRCWSPGWFGRGVTFVAVVMAWVLFRATEVGQAQDLWFAMVGGRGFEVSLVMPIAVPIAVWVRGVVLLGLLLVVWFAPNTQAIAQRFQPTGRWAIALGAIGALTFLAMSQPSEFLYFQF
ncbi:MAG: MBOAT family protein [Coleofasciculaceae cyanobacterium RL_1_1]|nr:MBOAT family protein [Coleofasciculaceae cyanobacterium RL_1_1]